jgi:hypothetical protein
MDSLSDCRDQYMPNGADALAEILGIDFAETKKRHWNQCGASCGTETIMTDTNKSGEVTVRVLSSSRDKTIQSIKIALQNNCLRPHDAATLHGKLGYVLGFGKTGRAALQPIVEREHSTSTNYDLNESLQASLETHHVNLMLIFHMAEGSLRLLSSAHLVASIMLS